MGEYILVILVTAVLFLTMILMLAMKPRFASRMTGVFLVTAAVGGLFFYGYGFSVICDSSAQAIIRALLGVCGMFVAKMDLASISAAPMMQESWAQLLFWIIHLLALYSTASAAITTVGAEALRKLRLWLARWGQLNLIYGVSAESIELGKKIMVQKSGAVVFVDSRPDAGDAAAIAKIGCVLRSDESALKADVKFLKSIGGNRRSRKITLYVLKNEVSGCMRYAVGLLESLQHCGVKPEQTSLVIRGQEDSSASALQVLGDRYGYGFVTVIQEAGLAARILMQNYPPCQGIAFDAEGKATEDFEALVIGFGQIGQAVLRNLVMNGQFEGSQFRASVFSPDCQSVNGFFSRTSGQVLKHYDISFHPYDARSAQMYDHLTQRGEKIKYLVVCAGSDKINHEIAENLTAFFGRMGWKIPIYLCSHQGVRAFAPDGRITGMHSLYQPEVLSMGGIDQMAMIVNHHYQGDSGRSAMEDWINCDYFSRMSCRAVADFMPAMLHMTGKTKEQVLAGQWNFTEAMLENLSRTEHRRWCAFHYCMGFRSMSQAEYDWRAQRYQEQLAAGEKPTIRIGKNMQNRTHACLIDWDALDGLSERETAITGKKVNYKAMDTENVLAVPKLLRVGENNEV